MQFQKYFYIGSNFLSYRIAMKGSFSPHNPWRAYAWRIANQIQRTAPAEEIKHITSLSSNLQNTKLLRHWPQMKETEGKELGQITQDPQKIKTCHSTMERRIFEIFKCSRHRRLQLYGRSSQDSPVLYSQVLRIPQFLACQNSLHCCFFVSLF